MGLSENRFNRFSDSPIKKMLILKFLRTSFPRPKADSRLFEIRAVASRSRPADRSRHSPEERNPTFCKRVEVCERYASYLRKTSVLQPSPRVILTYRLSSAPA